MRAPRSASSGRAIAAGARLAGRRRGRRVGAVAAGHRRVEQRRVGDAARHRTGRVLACARSARCRRGSPGRPSASGRPGRRSTPARRSSHRSRCRRRAAPGSPRPPPRCPSSSRSCCGRARTGLRVRPPRALQPLTERVERMLAHSLRLVLPRITAPASRRRLTTCASRGARTPSSASEPARRAHAVAGRDVVLDQHRHAVQRAAQPAGLALAVERLARSRAPPD